LSPIDDRSADDPLVAALTRLREALAGFDAIVRQRGEASRGDPALATSAAPCSDDPAASSAGDASRAGPGG
jgi:hypothetical protein